MSAPRRPLVSVVIPSFNQGRFVSECLASCLAQDWRPLEVIVMDGGSTDDTVARLRAVTAPELKWWSARDGGVVDAVNKGLARASGDVLSIQSTDDAFLPGALSTAAAALQARPEAGIAFGDVELMDADSNRIGADVQGPFDLARYLGRLQYIPQPGTCFTRRALEAAGGWRDSVSYAADADFWMRIAVRMPVLKIDRLLGVYRYHDEQRDKQRARIAADWERAVMDLLSAGVLTPEQQRYARMGIHLAKYRYAPESAWVLRTRSLYAAAWSNPRAVRDPHFPRRDLLPGRAPLFAALSKAKRALGLRPRSV